MRRYLLKAYYSWRFRKAMETISGQYQRHKDAGHEVYMNLDTETRFSFYCVSCPEDQPLRRRPEDVIHIYRGHDGRPYNG